MSDKAWRSMVLELLLAILWAVSGPEDRKNADDLSRRVRKLL